MAIADTVIPSISIQSTTKAIEGSGLEITEREYVEVAEKMKAALPAEADVTLVERYLQETASSIPDFRENLQRTFSQYVREDARKGIALILSALK